MTTTTTEVQTGTLVRYEDAVNPPRDGIVIGVEVTPWGTQYGVRFDGEGFIHSTDLRQRGWTVLD